MANLTKFRAERDVFAIDFAADLDDGETLASVTSLAIRRANGPDKTSEFRTGENDPTISGTEVQFWLTEAASAGAQIAGAYEVRCEVLTSANREIVAASAAGVLPILEVFA